MSDDKALVAMGVRHITVPEIKGNWYGIEHLIRVEKTIDGSDLPAYRFWIIDTVQSPDTGSFWYTVDFLNIAGQPYAELISVGINRSEHDFSLVTSTYARINKLTEDTIIIRMMNSAFTEGWLKGKGYKYFVTSQDKNNEDHPLYITEDLPRLANLLKDLYKLPQAFKEADTLLRKRQSF